MYGWRLIRKFSISMDIHLERKSSCTSRLQDLNLDGDVSIRCRYHIETDDLDTEQELNWHPHKGKLGQQTALAWL